MVKTTVYLEDRTKKRLARAAVRRRTSEAELIRSAINHLLDREPPPRKPRLGVFASGDPDLADRVDDELAVGFGRDGIDW